MVTIKQEEVDDGEARPRGGRWGPRPGAQQDEVVDGSNLAQPPAESAEDTGNKNGAFQPPPPVDESNLTELSAKQAEKFGGFPVGCRVWYNFQSATNLDCCAGAVELVLMDSVSRRLVFQVKRNSIDDDASDKVYEGNLSFANGCSVKVKRDDQWVDGDVMCAKPAFEGGAVEAISYDVILSEGNRIKIVHDIPAEHVKYSRTIDVRAAHGPAADEQITDSAASNDTHDEEPPRKKKRSIGSGAKTSKKKKVKQVTDSKPEKVAESASKKKRIKEEPHEGEPAKDTESKRSKKRGSSKADAGGQDKLVKRGQNKGKSLCNMEKWWFEKACVRFGWGNWEQVKTFLPDRTVEECQNYGLKIMTKHPGTKESLVAQHKADWSNPGGLKSGSRVMALCPDDKVWKCTILRLHQRKGRSGYDVHYDGMTSESCIWVPVSKVVEIMPDC